MYIIKNALRCIGRSKSRNILIGIIALVIAISACIGLSIRQAADSAKASALDGMSITANITYNWRDSFNDNKNPFEGGCTTEITRRYHIIDMMIDVRVGDVVTLKILRAEEEKTVSITITEDCLTAY